MKALFWGWGKLEILGFVPTVFKEITKQCQ